MAEVTELLVTGTTKNGQTIAFRKLTEFSFRSDRFSPADRLRFTALDAIGAQRVTQVQVKLGGKVLFDGIVDVQKRQSDEQGKRVSFVCRSRTCLMLDNEVKPYLYVHLSAEELVQKHAAPYGVTGFVFPYNAVLEQVLARKGISHWEFVCFFCKRAFGKVPYLTADGRLALTPFGSKVHVFGTGGTAYAAATVREDRYNMISKLYIKTSEDDWGANYGRVMENKVAEAVGVVRERYYHPSVEWENDLWLSGASIIREKQLDYFEIEVQVPRLLEVRVGELARFQDEMGVYDNLYVAQVKLDGGADGFSTTVKLWDKQVV